MSVMVGVDNPKESEKVEVVFITLNRYRDPNNEPTCRTKAGACFFLANTLGQRPQCLYVKVWTPHNSNLYDRENEFLYPHHHCIVWTEEEMWAEEGK